MTSKPVSLTIGLFCQILMVATLGQLTADFYLPSLPNIAQDLTTSSGSVQLTLAAYMLGFSLSQLVYGPLSDRIGRKPPILLGIGLSLFGALICMSSVSINMLIAGRFFQGIGLGACNSVGRSLSRDFLSGNELARVGSYMGIVSAFMLALAPTLGGYVQHYLSWRTGFAILSCYTLIIWLALWYFLPETHHRRNPLATRFPVIIKNYFTLLTHKTFLGYSVCSSMAYAGLAAYLTATPFLMRNILHLTAIEFGWLSLCTAGALCTSAFINGRLVMRFGYANMLRVGVIIMLTGSVLLFVFNTLGTISVFNVMLPITIFALGTGFSFQNAFAGAFQSFPHIAGSAGALYGFIQILGGSLSSTLVAHLHESNALPLAVVLFSFGFLSLLSWKFLAAVPVESEVETTYAENTTVSEV